MATEYLRLEGLVTDPNVPKAIRLRSLGCKSFYQPEKADKLILDARSVTHNLILAHAYTVKAFREKFQPRYGGKIGITLDTPAYLPWDESPESKSWSAVVSSFFIP